MTQLSYLSDNQLRFVIKTDDGDIIDPRTTWCRVHLKSGGSNFVATNDPFGDGTKRCHIDESGVLVIDIPSKKLEKGVVEYMVEVREDSPYFDDGYKNTFPLSYTQTDIEIV